MRVRALSFGLVLAMPGTIGTTKVSSRVAYQRSALRKYASVRSAATGLPLSSSPSSNSTMSSRRSSVMALPPIFGRTSTLSARSI